MTANLASATTRKMAHPHVTTMPVLPQKDLDSMALRVHSNKHTLQRHYSIMCPEHVIKMELSQFENSHAGLANMCAGEPLEADSRRPAPPAAPVTPAPKIQ